MFENKKVALVATGGGGRAIAHAGVIRACEKMGIKFDLMLGTSAGAIGVVLYSIYKDTDRIVDNFRPFWKRKYDFPAFGWKRMMTFRNFFSTKIKSGIFDLDYAERFLASNLPVNNFNELPIPTYVSVTNLDRHEGMLIGPKKNDHISISKAITASCCVPVLFRPVEINGEFYVDGEIKRPLSVNEAMDLGAEVVIVSDIYSPYVKGIGQSSMWNIGSQITNMLLGDKSQRGISICQSRYPDRQIVLISPPVGDISALNTMAYDTLVMRGYNSAIKQLREVQNGP